MKVQIEFNNISIPSPYLCNPDKDGSEIKGGEAAKKDRSKEARIGNLAFEAHTSGRDRVTDNLFLLNYYANATSHVY